MIVKRDVSIYDFSTNEDRKGVERLLESLIQIQNLIPVIGSGFTRGLRTKDGIVPSVDELKKEMISIMHSIDGSTEDEFADITLADFSDTVSRQLRVLS